MFDTAVAIGTCSGKNVDKFDRFALTPVNARHIGAPLILECLANIECKVIDIVERHSIVVLQGVAAYIDETREEKRMIHAIGDRLEEHTSELQSLMRISYAVFSLKKTTS